MNQDLLLEDDLESEPELISGQSARSIQALSAQSRWRARKVKYFSGSWDQLESLIPTFTKEPFRAGPDAPANPHYRSVMRQPLSAAERPIPVGVVSPSYSLAQHKEVIGQCFVALQRHAIDTSALDLELGLTPLGEWMNFRIYFPTSYDFLAGDQQRVRLRLECVNSVDGSSRLVVLLGWLRLVCSNGLIIGKTLAHIREIHDENLDLSAIASIISDGLSKVRADRRRLTRWETTEFKIEKLIKWADGPLTKAWGKTAACRVLHICNRGVDVSLAPPFEEVSASQKSVKPIGPVPGSAVPARNLYAVGQALSWVASQRSNPEERILWQSRITGLISKLAAA